MARLAFVLLAMTALACSPTPIPPERPDAGSAPPADAGGTNDAGPTPVADIGQSPGDASVTPPVDAGAPSEDAGPSSCGGIRGEQCPDGLVCDRSDQRICGADIPGVCIAPRDGNCPENVEPVCGCDGITYNNDCERTLAYVGLNHEGPCQGSACGGADRLECGDGQVCDLSHHRQCADDLEGNCVVPEEERACPANYAPVCGCDGRSYGNDCLRRTAYVALDHQGACNQGAQACGGQRDLPCPRGQVCDLSGNQQCGVDLAGICVQDTLVRCTREWVPVCGCDARTYGNDCQRRAARVAFHHEGECN